MVGCICINTYICVHEEKSWVCSALELKVKAGCRNASRAVMSGRAIALTGMDHTVACSNGITRRMAGLPRPNRH